MKDEATFELYSKKQVGKDFLLEAFRRNYVAILGVRKMRAPEIKKEEVPDEYVEKIEPPREAVEYSSNVCKDGPMTPTR